MWWNGVRADFWRRWEKDGSEMGVGAGEQTHILAYTCGRASGRVSAALATVAGLGAAKMRRFARLG